MRKASKRTWSDSNGVCMREISEQEEEWKAEAERLAQLDRKTQCQILAMHWIEANNSKLSKRHREFARLRVEALERHLRRLNRKL